MGKVKTEQLINRFESLQSKYKELENEINRDEAILEVKKEEVIEKRKELEDKGITFKGMKDLLKIKEDLEERIDKQVSKMESILGEDGFEEELDI